MGVYFETIVDQDVSLEEASQTAGKMLAWLVKEGVVQETPQDCVLGGEDGGYPPGPRYRDVLTDRPDLDLHGFNTNGLRIVIGRMFFYASFSAPEVICPHCGDCKDGEEEWSEAVIEWYEQKGEGLLKCENCCQSKAVTEWLYDPPWGFGNLGFEFWNWWPFKDSFLQEFTARLGHRTVLVIGKL